MNYNERLRVPLRWWAIATMFLASVLLAFLVATPAWVAFGATGVLSAGVVALFLGYGAARISVHDGVFTAGRATSGVNYHGMRVSPDGNRLYVADIGQPGDGVLSNGGLKILDVSEIQDRVPNPDVPAVSSLQWRSGSIPQVPIPMRINGRDYLLEMDEFSNFKTTTPDIYDPSAKVGAARIIDIDNEKHPRLVSNIRLQVNQPKNRKGAQRNDPGTTLPVQGYAGHYCSIPRRVNPRYAACSFIASGLRVFDIRDPRNPKEIAYFNQPQAPGGEPLREGAFAMSAPAWDLKKKQIWYTDGNTGFFALRFTNGVLKR